MKTATCVAKHLDGWKGHASLYRLDPPAPYQSLKTVLFGRILHTKTTSYVVVSAVREGPEGPEAFIYASDEEGKTKSMLEMNGSRRGTLDHEEVLLAAGYLVIP